MHTIHLGKSIQAAQKIHGISNATVARVRYIQTAFQPFETAKRYIHLSHCCFVSGFRHGTKRVY